MEQALLIELLQIKISELETILESLGTKHPANYKIREAIDSNVLFIDDLTESLVQ